MIPDGWTEMPLKEVFKLGSGDSRPKDLRPGPQDDHTSPVYGGNGILGYSRDHNSSGDDIIIGRVGEYCGVTRLVQGRKWITDNALFVKSVEPGFSRQFLALRLQHFDVSKLRSKGGQPLVSQEPIYAQRFAFPPRPEQEVIVSIVSTWDFAIATVEALITNARAQKKALMQSLLTGKHRLPGFSGEWKRAHLGELGHISSAGVDKKLVEGETTIRLLNFLDVYKREFIFDSDLRQVVTAPAAKVSQCNVRKGDVFFTPSSETRDDIALSAVAAEDMPGVAYSYHVVRFRPSETLDLGFSAYLFQTDAFRFQAARFGDGSGQRYVISQPNFRKMEVVVPPMAEQTAIGAILKNQSDSIGQLQSQLTALRKEKSALMQQLLTGKRRVKVDEGLAA